MDFRFAGFISTSLLAHLALLIAGAESLTPKIGGKAATLSVTLVTNPQLNVPSPVPQAHALPAASTPPAPAPAPVAIISGATSAPTPLQRAALPAKRPDAQPPAQHMVSVSTAATLVSPAQHVSEQISAALQNQLVKQFSYPWLARKRGWQGRVMLSLHIEKNGDLSRWKIARTSGYQVLDTSALNSARRIRKLEHAASLLNGTALDLLVPVHYQLLDG